MVACKKSHADAASSAGADTTSSASHSSDDSDDAKDPPLDCNKVFSPADAAGILSKSATVSAYTPRPRSCRIEVPNGGGMNIYTGSDFTSEMSWNDVTKSVDSLKYTALRT